MMESAVAEINGLSQWAKDPSSILPGESTGFRIGSRSSRQGTSTRQANLYEGSACPGGQEVVQHVSTPVSPAYIGAPTSKPSVYCRAIPPPTRAAPPPPVAGPTYTTTISPVLQTQISPQISPVFQQVQDSPGATQAGAPSMVAPGGMDATGGGSGGDSGAMLEFMRMQSEQQATQRQSDTAARERERQDREARDYAFQQAQLDFQREQARIQNERQAAIDSGNAEEAARLQAEYQRQQSEWEQTSAQPGGMVATAVMPGREMIEVAAPGMVPSEKPGLPVPLIVAGVAVLAVGGYYFYAKKGKRK